MKDVHHGTGAMLAFLRTELIGEDDVLVRAKERARAAGLPAIEVPPEDGALLATLVRLVDARIVVEIGTLFGYSAIWMARELPDTGHLITIERDGAHAAIARENIADAGLADRVTVLEGEAAAVLRDLQGPVDLVFIDADKAGYPRYLAWARTALRPGGALAADNAFLQGRVADPSAGGEDVEGMRRFLQSLLGDLAWRATVIPTTEGLALGVRR